MKITVQIPKSKFLNSKIKGVNSILDKIVFAWQLFIVKHLSFGCIFWILEFRIFDFLFFNYLAAQIDKHEPPAA